MKMMEINIKKIMKCSLCIIVLISILSACGMKASKDLPIYYLEVSYVIDIENPREVVGFGDYVFVAHVNEEIETVHKNVEWIHFKKTSMPYTVYSITVIENLKGNINKNTPVEIERFGGVNIDNDSISLPRGDVLLEAGAYYIFIASSDHDGNLGQAAPSAAIKLDIESENEIIPSEEYKDYIKYCEEEIVFGRQRFKSRYEETISSLENEQKQLQDRNDQIRSEESVLKQELMKLNLSDSWNEL